MSVLYDVIVVGGGPGGYVAAIRCAQLGMATVCIDDRMDAVGHPSLGGTCLNVGCIPSKALLESSEQYHRIRHQVAAHGIQVEKVSMDIARMQARKEEIVTSLTGGIAALFKANKVTPIFGRGRLMSDKNVAVLDPVTGEVRQTLTAKNIILAPGSVPMELSAVPYDGQMIVDSTGALNFDRVPDRLGIIGAGVIGLELGSVWCRLGSQVVLLEALPNFLALADTHVSREAARQFRKQDLEIRLGAVVDRVSTTPSGLLLHYTRQGEPEQVEVDRVIVAVGRRPATEGLLAADCSVSTDSRGFIEVNDLCRTAEDGVWAIGDAVRGPMLAHKSSEEGVAVAERIAGKPGHVDFNLIPWVIYTAPEIAWVGKTEQQLASEGIPVRTGMFPFAATGRAKAMEDPTGMVKVVAHAETDRVLGVHMVGPHVSELMAECVVAMAFHASSEDIARIVHAHPTLSEAVHEAALAVDRRAIHKFG